MIEATIAYQSKTLAVNELDHAFREFIRDMAFPCVGAKTALETSQLKVFKAANLGCSADDERILDAVYAFIADVRSEQSLFKSLIVVFEQSEPRSEVEFEQMLWNRLQALHYIDSKNYHWDSMVSSDPKNPHFSFSLGGKAFYVVGLHPASSRPARRFAKAALVFNLHEQFENLRRLGDYGRLQSLIRRRDKAVNGSVNPMLANFGERSEARQYSGRAVSSDWQCPFVPTQGPRAHDA